MADESMLKNKSSTFFDEKREHLAPIPLHKWLLISACVLIFLVLPLLFIWSSLGIIHNRANEQDSVFWNVGSIDKRQ